MHLQLQETLACKSLFQIVIKMFYQDILYPSWWGIHTERIQLWNCNCNSYLFGRTSVYLEWMQFGYLRFFLLYQLLNGTIPAESRQVLHLNNEYKLTKCEILLLAKLIKLWLLKERALSVPLLCQLTLSCSLHRGWGLRTSAALTKLSLPQYDSDESGGCKWFRWCMFSTTWTEMFEIFKWKKVVGGNWRPVVRRWESLHIL